MKKKDLLILGGIATSLVATFAYAGHYFYNFAINTKTNKEDIMGKSDPDKQKKRETIFSQHPFEEFTIKSFDGLNLYGAYYPGTTHTWVIAVHGYSGSHIDMGALGQEFVKEGYHVLMIDQRGHGQSEGNYTGMGHLERYDIANWIQYILRKDQEAKIILYGVSMGAASVMMTTGLDLPDQVIACIEDCGFTNAKELFKHQLKQRYPLPMNWVILASNIFTKRRANYFFEQADALEALSHSFTPTLFIHGTKDDFVPYAMVHSLYNACFAPKEMYLVEGVGHAKCYRSDPKQYLEVILKFIRTYGAD